MLSKLLVALEAEEAAEVKAAAVVVIEGADVMSVFAVAKSTPEQQLLGFAK